MNYKNKLIFVQLVLAAIIFDTDVSIEFENKLSDNIQLVVTQNGQPMKLVANIAPNGRTTYTLPQGFAGNFRHGFTGKPVTLFEISNKVKDANIYYDLSVIDGFNVPMKVTAPDGTFIQAQNANAPDAYLFPADNTKTH
ncbi:unnamed protein product, partial [Didymodactylos carnosus]